MDALGRISEIDMANSRFENKTIILEKLERLNNLHGNDLIRARRELRKLAKELLPVGTVVHGRHYTLYVYYDGVKICNCEGK